MGVGRTVDAKNLPDEEHDVDGRWVHLDLCEAAVNNPLLYEGLGKNGTYIVAFHDPFYVGNWRGSSATAAGLVDFDDESISTNGVSSTILAGATALQKTTRTRSTGRSQFSPVEDVIWQYMSDKTHVIEELRGVDNASVAEAINEVSNNLVDMLQRLVRDRSRCVGP